MNFIYNSLRAEFVNPVIDTLLLPIQNKKPGDAIFYQTGRLKKGCPYIAVCHGFVRHLKKGEHAATF